MLNFREELIKTIEPKRGNPKIKKLAEDFLLETLKAIEKADYKTISAMKKITFVCTKVSIIVCLSMKISGIYSCNSYHEYTRAVFEETKRKLKLENFEVVEETEDSFSIIVP